MVSNVSFKLSNKVKPKYKVSSFLVVTRLTLIWFLKIEAYLFYTALLRHTLHWHAFFENIIGQIILLLIDVFDRKFR